MISSFQSFITSINPFPNIKQLSSYLNNKGVKEEEKDQIINEYNTSVNQPLINYSGLNKVFKSPMEDIFSGVKVFLNLTPNDYFHLNYNCSLQKNGIKNLIKDYALNLISFFPRTGALNPNDGTLFVGRKEGKSLLLQSNTIFNNTKDKIVFTLQHQNEKLDQSIYQTEYSHDFDRLNFSMKISNAEPFSFSTVSPIYKNLFLGIEAYKQPNEFKLGYNYSLFLKNAFKNKFGFVMNYLGKLNMMMLDACYKVNNKLNIGFNMIKTKNENFLMMQMQGGLGNEKKIVRKIYLIFILVCKL